MELIQLGKKRPRILFALEYYMADVHRGVVEYARRAGWMLDGTYAYSHQINPRQVYDGAVVSMRSDDSPLAECVRELAARGVPIVDLSRKDNSFPKVWEDDLAIGQLAGEHLLGGGHRSLGFVGMTPTALNIFDRCTGLKEFARTHECDFYEIWLDEDDVAQKMMDLPRPVGLLTGNDLVAIRFLELCLEYKIRVPEECSVLGVDDDELQAYASYLSLSSINTDPEGKGYKAARLLDELLGGAAVPTEPVRLQPVGISQRESTDAIALTHPELARAMEFLRKNFTSPITISDLDAVIGISRRHLQDLFRKHVSRTPLDELLRLRLNHARLLLRTSSLSIGDIARQSGLGNAHRLSRLFRQNYNVSPGRYRQQFSETAST
ncbi:MAG: substrate-binding domain-containing protein [Phycisphaerales bacterium]|mgnify:CR=1 FL=1|jgi:LacI family transcriptional regulator|nr:substrate-binding domain-containing protein [Phycisphaerales bacterium]MBT7171770.1 substrate-binding domain-containing protein [Phycisphaerales bacterium]